MGHNKLYRNFIILQEDAEYSKQKKFDNKVSGYAKVEAKGDKCRVSFYVQNLKSSEKYYMFLICYKKDNRKIVNLGSFEVDDSGKAEIANEYYINGIAGLNFSFDQISGAAICKKESTSFKYILYGFGNGETVKNDWKNCKVYDHDENKEKYIKKDCNCSIEKKEKKKDDKYKSDDKKHKFDDCEVKHKYDHKKDDDDKDKCEDKKDKCEDKKDKCEDKKDKCDDKKDKCEDKCDKYDKKNKWDDRDSEHDKDDKDDKDDKENGCLENICIREKIACDNGLNSLKRNRFDEYEAMIEKNKKLEKEEKKIIDPYDFELKGKLGEFFEGVVKGFKEIKNKFKEIKYCKWYKADVISIDDMCNTSDYNKYTIAYYPMINYYPYIKKYGYFVIGYKCDKLGNLKYIVYGVPGGKNKEAQPYGGKTGFVTWMKTDNSGKGLWLMFYDYKKSVVVVPKKE